MFDLNGSVISIHYHTQVWQDKVHKDVIPFQIHCPTAQLENIHFLRVDGTNTFSLFFYLHTHIQQPKKKKKVLSIVQEKLDVRNCF